MAIACFIRYETDPFQREAFKKYSENWGALFQNAGGSDRLLPAARSTSNVAWGLLKFDALAAYESYRSLVKAGPDGRADFETAQSCKFISREERTFVEIVEGTLGLPATAVHT